ncbi:SDR family NAD(P)-dependent oxidoreductase [Falsiroseomonas sp. E2-1-a20]|uniref:SDR family NAD(P)-dependent oxidoreductase n=1 Tax=Falsiroseomonas sp. E2-1-a20 TaxID=3239300 RepID=UPI003F32181D
MRDAELLRPEGRVVALSGASRGLGAAIAQRLHAEGYTLALGLRDVAATRRKLGEDRISYHRHDAAEPATAEAWIDAVVERHGRLDALINNAGILRRVTWEEGGEAELDELWTVNVKAPFRATRRALPHLRAAGHGRVVNIASTDGKRIRDPSVSIGYAMTKHALVALSQAAKFAGWEDGVRVTALCPGAIDTELLAGLPGVSSTRLSPATVAEIVALLLRLPDTATIAELVVNTRLEHTL